MAITASSGPVDARTAPAVENETGWLNDASQTQREYYARGRGDSLDVSPANGPLPCDHNDSSDDEAPGEHTERYRTVWVSDIHLGTRGCKAEYLLDFLRHVECDTLYLVGDIVDGWSLKRSWYWAQSHNDVVQKLLRKARKGTRIVYIPGNHDEGLRDYCATAFGGIEIRHDAIHETADGRRLLVLHGDEFDIIVRYARWLALFGSAAYGVALSLNQVFNAVRRRAGLPYWSLSAFLKLRVKKAVDFISRFETAIAEEARRRGVHGVVCGHIHHAEIRDIDGIAYHNDGDWVESCTALVEHADGRMEILHWAERMPHRAAASSKRAEATVTPLHAGMDRARVD